MNERHSDVAVIGAGQAGLAVAYYLRRAGLDFAMFDAGDGPGGAWVHTWRSLRLFSPATYSSLPGWPMPPSRSEGFPTAAEVIDYLSRYEARYEFPIVRPFDVRRVVGEDRILRLVAADGTTATASHVVSATGTWRAPYFPGGLEREIFAGIQLHSAEYREPAIFAGKRVAVVGGGNSGAQILAEISEVAETIWITPKPPVFLPDDVDGRVLFELASARVRGDTDLSATTTIGDIVMVPPVVEARARGVLNAIRPFQRMTRTGAVWADGSEIAFDAVVWCTGFRPATDHLRSLGIVDDDGRVDIQDQRSVKEPRLWLAGYGNWTGAASATLIGAGRTARELVPRIQAALGAA